MAGAIEYIIAYAKETWRCPVYFYTGTRSKDFVQYLSNKLNQRSTEERWTF